MNAPTTRRFCIFCGEQPERKNREHPLPQWLLRLTGDPTRVVKHGYHWDSGRNFEFSWDSLAFPACEECNSNYSTFEGEAKHTVEKICRRDPVDPMGYVHLLDWLDKVRIGLWLGYRYLQNDHFGIPPKFTINSRIGAKDRMVAVYAIGDHQVGLNTWGVETPLFQFKPSVFSMRVNNTLFLNASWDWMCSSRCGYPFPRHRKILLDQQGLMEVGDFRCRRKITHPVIRKIVKPCVLVCQPIVQPNADGSLTGFSQKDFDYCLNKAWPGRNGVGPLFRQFKGNTIQIGPDDEDIAFDTVSNDEARRTVDIATQAYSFQNESVARDEYESADLATVEHCKMQNKDNLVFNRRALKILRSMTPEEYKRHRETP